MSADGFLSAILAAAARAAEDDGRGKLMLRTEDWEWRSTGPGTILSIRRADGARFVHQVEGVDLDMLT